MSTSTGSVEQVAPGVTRVRADNPGVMTLDGTNTWILRAPGAGGVVVVDPGPADAAHAQRVREVVAEAEAQVELVLLTHGHLDHSEGAAGFAASADAPLRARAGQWSTATTLEPGERIAAAGLELEVLATPGHTSDSVSFAVGPHLLTGDTVLGRGTTVVAHPDGRLDDYLASLDLLRRRADGGVTRLLPGHGPVIDDPAGWIDFYLTHRHERLRAVAEVADQRGLDFGEGQSDLDDVVTQVVEVVYADVPQHLWPAAALSVHAQLIYLQDRGGIQPG